MDFNTYINEALTTKTETSYVVDYDESEFIDENIANVGECVDNLKKAIFYGKNLQKFTFPTYPHKLRLSPETQDAYHALLGIVSEAAELFATFNMVEEDTKPDGATYEGLVYHFVPGNQNDVMDELGDIFWYLALLMNHLDVSLEEVLDKNLRKLKARFPEKFEASRAINKDPVVERNAQMV